MSRWTERYHALIGSAEQLELCKRAGTPRELLATIKYVWNCPDLSDDRLLGEIARLNQKPVVAESARLAGRWLPYRYQPKTGRIDWLLPFGHATEPFHDEYISRCRQQLPVNQIIRPWSALQTANSQAKFCQPVQPAGFIFHLSRCGSTLASGCLSELDSTCVFSESPLLTDILLDKSLSAAERKKTLRSVIDLQAAVFPERPRLIIKWNAWDIFNWDLIRELYPQVPSILLMRDPVDILASHQKSAGRHMAVDMPLTADDSVPGLLSGQIRMLSKLQSAFLRLTGDPHAALLDYRQLDATTILRIADFFNCGGTPLAQSRIKARMRFHSKNPAQVFVNEPSARKGIFDAKCLEIISTRLKPDYGKLLARTWVTEKRAANVF